MNLFLNKVTLVDAGNPLNGKSICIRIEKGIITEMGANLTAKKGEKVIEESGLKVSAGWFDSSVSMGEPGFEERETLDNGLKVAAKSGFTGVALQPNTDPPIDSKSAIRYVLHKAEGQPVELFPIGTLTRKAEGIDLAELYDMQQAGAVAFGDYQKSIKNPNLLKLALQYTQGFDGLVISFPQEDDLVGKGMANEGINATHLGLKGMPALAESLHVSRDLHLLEYAGGKLHIPTISTEASVKLIKGAKKKGLDVSCSVAIANLFFTDDTLDGFDTRFKLLPPLRTEKDRKALLKGCLDGTIDMVCSDHNPIDIEHKKLEFDNAIFGGIAQEVTFAALLTLIPEDRAVKLLTAGRKRFTGKTVEIKKDAPANLSLFKSEGKRTYQKEDILAKSKNSAFLGAVVQGQVFGIIAGNKFIKTDI